MARRGTDFGGRGGGGGGGKQEMGEQLSGLIHLGAEACKENPRKDTNLQHPSGNYFPHIWQDFFLHALEVGDGGRAGLLRLQHCLQHPVIEEVGI